MLAHLNIFPQCVKGGHVGQHDGGPQKLIDSIVLNFIEGKAFSERISRLYVVFGFKWIYKGLFSQTYLCLIERKI